MTPNDQLIHVMEESTLSALRLHCPWVGQVLVTIMRPSSWHLLPQRRSWSMPACLEQRIGTTGMKAPLRTSSYQYKGSIWCWRPKRSPDSTLGWEDTTCSDNENVDWLALIVSGSGDMKLLGVPKVRNGTDEAQATAVFQLICDWHLNDRIRFVFWHRKQQHRQ